MGYSKSSFKIHKCPYQKTKRPEWPGWKSRKALSSPLPGHTKITTIYRATIDEKNGRLAEKIVYN